MKKAYALIGTLLFFFSTAQATVWYVHPDSTLNSIQAALDSCVDNDTVLVGPGIYFEHLAWPNIQGINLSSQNGSDTTVINGDGLRPTIDISYEVDTTTIIDGFTVRNGKIGIHLYGASPTIIDNLITNNTNSEIGPAAGGGIACWYNASPIISRNTIANNTVGGLGADGGGIACWENSSPHIIDNTITGNVCSGGLGALGGGISCVLSSTPIIIGNTIANNSVDAVLNFGGGGIACFESSPTIDSNTIANNNGGGISCSTSTPTIHYNNIVDNIGYGVENRDSTITLNATNNWWGDATGPYHPTANPGGLGDTVSDYVDFDPWLYNPWGIEEEPIVKPVDKHKTLHATIFSGPLLLPENRKCKVFDITGRAVEPTNITHGIYFIVVDGHITQKVVKVR